jgi:hypothetical protein
MISYKCPGTNLHGPGLPFFRANHLECSTLRDDRIRTFLGVRDS